MKDNFSTQAGLYAQYRPDYPQELFDHICALVPEKKIAWDCGTGNGQTAAVLARYFEKVYATDISASQIGHAAGADNIKYALEPAEKTSLETGTVDLITVSQALHWFDIEKFYAEARRVATQQGIIAIWTYGLLQIDAVTDRLINGHHYETLGSYWDKERVHVDNGYKNIPFPFKEIQAAPFFIIRNWNPQQLEGYLNTWSGLQKFISSRDYNPVNALMEKITENWPAGEVRKIIFPITLKTGYVH